MTIKATGHQDARPSGWQAWQDSWDRQQEWYLPDREERFRVMLDMVEALVGTQPRVLDLACGTGSISDRVLKRFGMAETTGVDLDPALLTIARGYFAEEPRATFVTANLADPHWTEQLPHRSYDAVLSATALHWLSTDALSALYGQVAGVVRDGGVFMNADHMAGESTPRISEAGRAFDRARREAAKAAGARDWAGWWQLVIEDERLNGPATERFGIFGNPVDGDHSEGEVQSADWHARTLRGHGFAEARAVWSSPSDALVLGLR